MQNIDELKLFNRLEKEVTRAMEIPADSLTSRLRTAKFITARRIVAYIMRDVYGMKSKTICVLLKRDPTAVANMLNRDNHLSLYPALMQIARQICEGIASEFPPPSKYVPPVEMENLDEPNLINILITRLNAVERQLRYIEKKVGIIRY